MVLGMDWIPSSLLGKVAVRGLLTGLLWLYALCAALAGLMCAKVVDVNGPYQTFALRYLRFFIFFSYSCAAVILVLLLVCGLIRLHLANKLKDTVLTPSQLVEFHKALKDSDELK